MASARFCAFVGCVNLRQRISRCALGDGRWMLALAAAAVTACGMFMVATGMSGSFLVGQAARVGITLDELSSIADSRLAGLMFHDHVGCGGAVMGTGILLLWFAVRARSLAGDAARREDAAAVQHGRRLLLAVALGVIASGVIIAWVGATTVLLDEDHDYLGLKTGELKPALLELMSRDRIGYGAAVFCCGCLMFASMLCGASLRGRWPALFIAGTCGFATTIGVHFPIGYTQFAHVGPAYIGALLFYVGMALIWRRDGLKRGG